MFETQKSGNKTSSGEIGLDIRTHASPKVGQELVSRGVSVLCWHAAPCRRCSYMKGTGVTSIIKVYTDVRLEWGILFRPPSI